MKVHNPKAALIREATPEDATEIAKVHVASWRAAYKGIVPDTVLDELNVDTRAQSWEKLLKQSDLPCLLIMDQEGIIGFAALCRSRDPDRNPSEVAEIAAIYLDPQYYRQGNGMILMQHAMETITTLGFSEVDIWVLEKNLAARRFYEKSGFKEDGAGKDLDRLTQREIRYKKSIRAPGNAGD